MFIEKITLIAAVKWNPVQFASLHRIGWKWNDDEKSTHAPNAHHLRKSEIQYVPTVENMNNEHTSKAKGDGGEVEAKRERCDFCYERRMKKTQTCKQNLESTLHTHPYTDMPINWTIYTFLSACWKNAYINTRPSELILKLSRLAWIVFAWFWFCIVCSVSLTLSHSFVWIFKWQWN